jgi:hypothetical protein
VLSPTELRIKAQKMRDSADQQRDAHVAKTYRLLAEHCASTARFDEMVSARSRVAGTLNHG